MIYVKKVVISDKLSFNKEKNWWYIVGSQVDGETIISLFIKTPNNICSNDLFRYVSYSMFLG